MAEKFSHEVLKIAYAIDPETVKIASISGLPSIWNAFVNLITPETIIRLLNEYLPELSSSLHMAAGIVVDAAIIKGVYSLCFTHPKIAAAFVRILGETTVGRLGLFVKAGLSLLALRRFMKLTSGLKGIFERGHDRQARRQTLLRALGQARPLTEEELDQISQIEEQIAAKEANVDRNELLKTRGGFVLDLGLLKRIFI